MKKIICLLSVLIMFSSPVVCEPEFNIYNTPQQYNPQKVKKSENVLIILDCSYSMEDDINGMRKIDIARGVINEVLKHVSGDVNVGLRVYGHTKSLFGLSDCKATELLVPIAPNTQNAVFACMKKLNPVGWTPICYSLEQAIQKDFTQPFGKKRIILVSDGMETCGGSPCDFAVNLMKTRKDISIDVIGFDLASEPEAISQLKCVALATHGKFYTADNSYEFTESLKNSLRVKKEVQGEIFLK